MIATIQKREVRRIVADDPAALPEEGEEGIVYEFEVWEDGIKLAVFYSEELAHQLAAVPELVRAVKTALPALEAMAGFSRTPQDRNAAQAGLDALIPAVKRAEKRA